jgi:hypothetical protein
VIDLTGRFLLPGLVDMHHHLARGAAMPGPPAPGQAAERDVRGNLKEMLALGVHNRLSTNHENVDLREFADLRRAATTDPDLPSPFAVHRLLRRCRMDAQAGGDGHARPCTERCLR